MNTYHVTPLVGTPSMEQVRPWRSRNPTAKEQDSLTPSPLVGAELKPVVGRLQHPKGPDSSALCEGKTEGYKLRMYELINHS